MQLAELVEDPDKLDKLANNIINRLTRAEILDSSSGAIAEAYDEIEEAVKEFTDEMT